MKHILVLPFALSGHIIPMLNLCCKLSWRGITKITILINQDFVASTSNLLDDLLARGDLAASVSASVESIPVILPPAFQGSVEQIEHFFRVYVSTGEIAEQAALKVLQSSSEPLAFVLSDFVVWWSQDLANKLGVPRVALSIIEFQEIGIILQMPWLISQGIYDPFAETEHGDLEAKVIKMPGYPALKVADIPRITQFPGANKSYWNQLLRCLDRAKQAKMILINSCDDLEGATYEAMLAIHKLPIHLAGPLLASPLESLVGSDECLRWLDRIASPRSVLFAAFGSFLKLPSPELEEILLGIEASGKNFLLVFRPDVVVGDPSPSLLAFLDRHKDAASFDLSRKQNGLIVSWAPQPEVLLHSSVGGFFTHFGWNSVLESIRGGIPMIGKPILGDQFGIRRMAVDRWKIAIDIEEDVRKHSVEKAVCELFGNEELYKNVARLSECLRRTVQEDGKSYQCWDMVANI